jgi:methyl-accepting chemotaxis protein
MLNLKLKGKLITLCLLLGLIPMIVIAIISLINGNNALEDSAFQKMIAIQQNQKNQIELLFETMIKDVEVVSSGVDAKNVYKALYQYHIDTKVKANGNFDTTTEKYKKIWREVTPYFQQYIRTYGYYDFFIICANHGHVMYTVEKESDLGENLAVGKLKDSGLGKLWKKIAQTKKTVIVDLEPYDPSGGAQAMFLGTPLVINGSFKAVIVLQVPTQKINNIVQQRAGMGETGESYLVGKFNDKTVLTTDRIVKNAKAGTNKSGKFIDKGLNGETGHAIKIGSTGNEEILAYAPLNIQDIKWMIMTTIAADEALASVNTLIWIITVFALIFVAIIIVISFLFSASITKPIASIINRLQSSSSELEAVSKQQSTASTEQTTATAEVSNTSQELVATAKQIVSNTQKVTETAETTLSSGQSGSKAVDNAQNGMGKTKKQVQLIAQHMLELGNKSQRIGMILEIINELSEQTNLLSLNATIEAAGAGDAGKRFAVVADEVRKLAERSVESTKEIKNLITDIQQTANTTIMVTEDGTKAVDEGFNLFGVVTETIGEIVNQAESTSSAAREIELISRQQTTSVEQVSAALNDINQSAKQTEDSANQTLTTVKELVNVATELNKIINN